MNESRVCIVNSHLSAGQDKVKQRIDDYKTICSRMSFEVKGRAYALFDHETVFWAGDLNFRTNVNSAAEALSLLNEKRMSLLLGKDQLAIERSKGNVFQGFEEGPIRFWPTYKYVPGTMNFDLYLHLARVGRARDSRGGATG